MRNPPSLQYFQGASELLAACNFQLVKMGGVLPAVGLWTWVNLLFFNAQSEVKVLT